MKDRQNVNTVHKRKFKKFAKTQTLTVESKECIIKKAPQIERNLAPILCLFIQQWTNNYYITQSGKEQKDSEREREREREREKGERERGEREKGEREREKEREKEREREREREREGAVLTSVISLRAVSAPSEKSEPGMLLLIVHGTTTIGMHRDG